LIETKKRSSPGPRGSGEFFFDAMMIAASVCLEDGNPSRCKLIGLATDRLGGVCTSTMS
jgi:hypothetical protein